MANPELIAYIKQNSAKFPKPQLTQTLIAGGWPAADVAAAFLEIESPRAPAPVPPLAPVAVPAAIGQSLPPTAGEKKTDENFLAEMEAHRKEAQRLGGAPIIEGNTQIRPTAFLQQSAPVSLSGAKGIAGMLIKSGLVKNEQQANIAMIGFIVAMLGFTVWFMWPSSPAPAPSGVSGITPPSTTSGMPSVPR